MITIENTEVSGFSAAIRGLRNPMNSWEKSDSHVCDESTDGSLCTVCPFFTDFESLECDRPECGYIIGKADRALMLRMNASPEQSKYRRMITVTCDITAPLYWWKEADTYKVGTVRNSCSTMHKITAKEFDVNDFSHEHLAKLGILKVVIKALNDARSQYLITKNKDFWWQIIQLLPSSYNQRATWQANYEVLAQIYRQRQNHKLDEWHTFCDWIKSLPYAELITGEE